MVDHPKQVVKQPTWLRANVSLLDHTTLKAGGVARWFGVIESIEDLVAAAHFAEQNVLPFRVIGSGSNLLVPDSGFAGVVVQNHLRGVTYEVVSDHEVYATVGAGEILDEVIADMVEHGYWGLENLSSIPGTVGATPVQNVGAYGVEVADCIVAVGCFHVPSAQSVTLTSEECQFGYRDSIFKTSRGTDYVIMSVTFRLSTRREPRITYVDLARTLSPQATLADIRSTVIAIRAQKFPDWRAIGTAGSFFKNPIITCEHALQLQTRYPALPVYPVSETQVKVSLGYILDKVCGLKGYTKNGVALYEKQALVLVNTQLHTDTILTFANEVAQIVYTKTAITIEREVTTLM